MLTQDHRKDGREWKALTAQVADLTAQLTDKFDAEPQERDAAERSYFQYVISKVWYPSVGDLKTMIEVLTIFLNNFHTPEKFSTMHNLTRSLSRDGKYTIVEMLTPDTIQARSMIYSQEGIPKLGSVDGYRLWSEIVHQRPHDAARIMDLVRERSLNDFSTAVEILDEMDKHHHAVSVGAI